MDLSRRLIPSYIRSTDHVAPAVKESFDFANDFPSKAHHITRWSVQDTMLDGGSSDKSIFLLRFGIHQFVLFSTTAESGTNVNEANLLLSSLAIAFDTIKWYSVFSFFFQKAHRFFLPLPNLPTQHHTGLCLSARPWPLRVRGVLHLQRPDL